MPLAEFHPAVAGWFEDTFGEATPVQTAGWAAIRRRQHTLIAAPTGSGKTLAAFLCAIDDLVRVAEAGPLEDQVYVLYVSPLKALSNDIHKNLELPLEGIQARLETAGSERSEGGPRVIGTSAPAGEAGEDTSAPAGSERSEGGPRAIRSAVRTGDTPAAERAKVTRKPPHILVTTPESLYILLTSEGGRRMLKNVRTVIVDEIHALAPNKRGAHLSLSIERLEALVESPLLRIGLSATQNPIEQVATFLVGQRPDPYAIVDMGHRRHLDVALELPESPLETVMSAEVWEELFDRMAALIEAHQTTLIFVNTRRLAERVTRNLSERLGKQAITSHHGSLSRKHRLAAEQRLKAGELRAVVATASLELGIDVGEVDLVCQIGSPHSVSAFLQRVGRSGHFKGGVPKGRLFPLSQDDLVECAALLRCFKRGELDLLCIPESPLDILAQQLVAAAVHDDWQEDALFERVRAAWPYRNLPRETFDDVVKMLVEGFATSRGRRGAYLHHDRVNGRIRARRNARLSAITSGGAIPDNFDFEVRLEPENLRVGTINEDFAIESMPGDIFQLGNMSYRILRVETGLVRVADAAGQPPSIPFWLGEAPSRSDLLSESVNVIREQTEVRGDDAKATRHWLWEQTDLQEPALQQLCDYLLSGRKALGRIPTQEHIVLERFFDETGAMHLVLHAPFGSRINRAWGLALRKRFCRSFNVELQAAATEDALVLSLGPTHSFPLEDVFSFLHSNTAADVLVQALLDAPMFQTRWRWNATRALAVLRFRGGKRTPPYFQRMQSDDLLALCFPDQVACLENVPGDREIPEHPLVAQTINDCLSEAMDLQGFLALLQRLESGATLGIARDLTEPSPFSQAILNARPYAFLDDAPLEERRTQAVQSRRWLDASQANDLGALSPEAIAEVQEQAFPSPRDADELHDALVLHAALPEARCLGLGFGPWFEELVQCGRATRLCTAAGSLWVAAERLELATAAYPGAAINPSLALPKNLISEGHDLASAQIEMVRGQLEALGPVHADQLAGVLGMSPDVVNAALSSLEREGFVLRGSFLPDQPPGSTQWCERGLLARIHRYTLHRLRREIQPVSAADFMRFLGRWQHAHPDTRMEGPSGLQVVIEQLEGFEAAAASWESDVLPLRMAGYDPSWLDGLCHAGHFVWARRQTGSGSTPIRSTPIAWLRRDQLPRWPRDASPNRSLSPDAERIQAHLQARGASFFHDVVAATGLLPAQAERGLGELVAAGMATADGFSGMRALLIPEQRRHGKRGSRSPYGMASAGRWDLLGAADAADANVDVEAIAWRLLQRWGVVFRRMLQREGALPMWRDLLRCYRRLEAQGLIRGGRFVAGFTGEQYALPEAVTLLRQVRKQETSGELLSVSGVDPLNLVGILTPDPRVNAVRSNRILYRDGVPLAVREGGDVRFLREEHADWQLTQALVQREVPREVRAYLGSSA